MICLDTLPPLIPNCDTFENFLQENCSLQAGLRNEPTLQKKPLQKFTMVNEEAAGSKLL